MLYMGSSIIAVVLVGILIATFIHIKARSRRRRFREEYFEVSHLFIQTNRVNILRFIKNNHREHKLFQQASIIPLITLNTNLIS